MDFSPAFALLRKFTIGISASPINEDEVRAVGDYLGIGFPPGDLDDQIERLAEELSRQNRFLSFKLDSDAIYDSVEFRKSEFIREIVANNRINLKHRKTHDR